MLNYLGPNVGAGPVTSMLPPATPGTIPSGVPGVAPSPGPLPSGGHAIHIHAHAPPSSSALAAILKSSAPSSNGPPAPPPPPDYGTTTQEDGSVLLHIKNPDGSLGPVVKVIPPIKRPDSGKK